MSRYSIVYEEHWSWLMERIDSMTKRARVLYQYVMPNIKTADTLIEECPDSFKAICEYCGTDDLDLLNQVMTVRFSLVEASRLFQDGNKKSGAIARNALIAAEIIAQVRKGTKGKSSLYVVLPLPDWVLNYQENKHLIQNDRVSNTPGNEHPISIDRVSFDSEKGVECTSIGCQGGISDQGVNGHIHNYPLINQKTNSGTSSKKGKYARCSEHGNLVTEISTRPGWYQCTECMSEIPESKVRFS